MNWNKWIRQIHRWLPGSHEQREVDIHEGEKVDAGAFKALVKAVVAWNGATAK